MKRDMAKMRNVHVDIIRTCKKPMQIENCSAFGGSSTSGTLTSTDSNLSNKDVRSATLTSTDSNNSVTRANNISTLSSQIDVFGFTSPKATEQPTVLPERPASQSRSTSGSDLRQITVLERLTKTHPIWFLPTVGRSGAVHLVKNKEIGIFIVRKSSREEIMALSVQFPCQDGSPNVDHYLIEPTENGLHLQGSTKLFSSIPHLIAHYCDNKEDLPHRLILPPAIRNVKTSQELSALAMLGQDFWISSKYDGPSKSRSSSRSNLSDHSSIMNKSVSEPISINNNNNKTLVPAYSQSEGILQNTPPKHSVIDFSSYLIKKPDQAQTVSKTFTQHESRLTESVQKTCSMMTNGSHASTHVTNMMHFGAYRSSEVVVTENSMVTVTENMCNRDSQISADYAQPDKSANHQASNSPVPGPVELLDIPEDYYFRSNLSDKMSDYEDIWKYADPNVCGVQADIVQRLQPNMLSFTSNSSVNRSREFPQHNSVTSEEFFSEKCVVKDVNKSVDNVTQEISAMKLTQVLQKDNSAVLPNGFIQHTAGSSNQNNVPECDNQSETINCAECVAGNKNTVDQFEFPNVKPGTFEPLIEHETEIAPIIYQYDEDCDADTEEGDVIPQINSVHTQTSPLWKSKSPMMHGSRRSASTSSLSTMRTPVYAEPFDAICQGRSSESSSKDRVPPKLPKKLRRKSAPAASHLEKMLRKQGTGRNASVSEVESEVSAQPEFENIEENEEVFVLSVEIDSDVIDENKRKSKLEKLYETAWVDDDQSQQRKKRPTKPKPSPRKTKQVQKECDNSVSVITQEKSFSEHVSHQESHHESKTVTEEPKFTINVLEHIKTMQEFEESNEIPSSPSYNKFPVYDRQPSMETKVSCYEGSTAEDMICSWNPELTLRPVKPFPVLQIYGAMSEYDNLNGTPYMAPSGQSVASVGTIFCNPWENSVLAKIMKNENVARPSPLSVNSPPPVKAPPPLPPPMDMVERIKAWQESSQVYHSFPNETLDNEYRLSIVSNANSVEEAVGSRTDFRVSSNGQNSSEKTLVNEKLPAHSAVTKDEVCDDIPDPTADIREKVAPVLANPRLLNKPPRSRNPDSKIREYIISLSKDSNTTFGSTIENFIQCTLESQDPNPSNITRNVRQFMNGIKNYLVKHGEGELEDLIERERVKLGEDEILNIDAIIEGSLHECVIQPLKQNIYRLFVNEYTRNGNLKLLSNNIKYARTKTPEEIGIRKGLSPPDGTTLEVIRQYLFKMQKSFSPLKKLENLLGATSTIYKCVASKQRGKNMCFGADDFLPMLIYVLVHCGTLSVEIEADYMWGLLHPSLLTGEGGYYLTSLSSAVLVLKKFKEMQETKASQHEGQMPSISDMHGFLKIALPNETNDTIEWRTLPVRPSMTTKDVCSMIAHKFKITNPQDFGLYTLENGEECRMMDMECPQMLKADRQSRGKECKFVYKRHAANIAWPKSVK